MRLWPLAALTCVLALAPMGESRAQAPAGEPLGHSTRVSSVEVLEGDLPIWSGPSSQAPRRGSAQLGARFVVLSSRAALGDCAGRWLEIGVSAWLCETEVRRSNWPPTERPLVAPRADGLPYDYHFVGSDGAFGYATLNLAEEGIPDTQLEPGFAVALVRTGHKPNGEAYGLTTHGLWLPLRDLVRATPSDFSGIQLRPTDPPLGWIFKANTPAFERPAVRGGRGTFARLSPVSIVSLRQHQGITWLELASGDWVRQSDVRRVVAHPPPADLGARERWIHVDTTEQVLTAYQGPDLVFATLVSTGKGPPGSELRTPTGQHRIWVKLVSTDMTHLEPTDASRPYAIEEVPWVMFFDRGYGLHAAFWHDGFGSPRSHGCVNLSPKDAAFLFAWAAPVVPPGWHAAHPTPEQPGLRIVVD